MYVYSFVQRICPLTFGTIALLFGQRIYPFTFAPADLSAHVCACAYLLSPPHRPFELWGSDSLPAIFPLPSWFGSLRLSAWVGFLVIGYGGSAGRAWKRS